MATVSRLKSTQLTSEPGGGLVEAARRPRSAVLAESVSFHGDRRGRPARPAARASARRPGGRRRGLRPVAGHLLGGRPWRPACAAFSSATAAWTACTPTGRRWRSRCGRSVRAAGVARFERPRRSPGDDQAGGDLLVLRRRRRSRRRSSVFTLSSGDASSRSTNCCDRGCRPGRRPPREGWSSRRPAPDDQPQEDGEDDRQDDGEQRRQPVAPGLQQLLGGYAPRAVSCVPPPEEERGQREEDQGEPQGRQHGQGDARPTNRRT